MKKFILKIYSTDGLALESTEGNILKAPRFSKSINGGLGSCNIELNYSFGELGSQVGKIARIYMVNELHKLGKLIYTGQITRQSEVYASGRQSVKLELLGIQSLLYNAYYKDVDYEVSHVNQDPKAIIEAIVDHFNTVYSGSLVSYSDSIDLVGTNVSYDFSSRKWFDSIRDVFDLIGTGWYWYINEKGVFNLHEFPTTATHTFTAQKDVERIEVTRNIEQIINLSYLNYDGGDDSENNAISQSSYGLRELYSDDQKINDSITASEFNDKKVNDNKDPRVETRLIINSEYDIESINPGDTCQVLNLPLGSDVLTKNMKIVRINYQGEKAVLYLEGYSFLHEEIINLTN